MYHITLTANFNLTANSITKKYLANIILLFLLVLFSTLNLVVDYIGKWKLFI